MQLTDISCYGVEFFDGDGGACPHTHCVAFVQCKKICTSAAGVLHDRKVRVQVEKVASSKIKKESKKRANAAFDSQVRKLRLGKQRKSGYDRPQKLDYSEEGCLRDEMMHVVFDFFKDTSYTVHTTKFIQSVSKDFVGPVKTKYLLKIATTRKKSILIYVREAICQRLLSVGIQCRKVYQYEESCFPGYLKWVAQVRSMDELDKFLGEIVL
tara:strand:- start:850 stop:1482 length:633 start_codon:yes stop_codon:yes gene_type:complete